MDPASIRRKLVRLRRAQFDDGIGSGAGLVQSWARSMTSPRPRIAKPNRGQNAQISGFGTTICDRDFDQDIFDIGFGIFHEYVEVAIFVEYTRIEQFELWLVPVAASIFLHQFRVRKLGLWVLVEILHV